MALFDELEFRLANPEDIDAIMAFTNSVFIAQAPVSKKVGLSAEDSELLYRPTVVESLRTPFSLLVFHRPSGDLIAYRIMSLWRRGDAQKTPASGFEIPDRLRLLGGVLVDLKKSFWDLCPNEVNAVLRREFSCVRKDFQRRGIASRMLDELLDEEELKASGIDGVMSETSSLANQALLAKKGFTALRDVSYASVIDSEGRMAIGAKCHDGSTKIVLNFKLFK
ncbi:hypothetical protein QR680_013201 [Steinernema hermaphroditum]|uniref:aralkylamine N-acetyltransferase n=1 Tax=Steinernema hermaphroditum TaxID=289476 RepID=A0AA39I4P6_9BILA|nr:hypothetical protein QR680_013201 [Steinernema hermaphroditum]